MLWRHRCCVRVCQHGPYTALQRIPPAMFPPWPHRQRDEDYIRPEHGRETDRLAKRPDQKGSVSCYFKVLYCDPARL